jgi:hypothetical protein
MDQNKTSTINKIWKLVIHPNIKSPYEKIFNNKNDLKNSLKTIGLNDTLIWFLFLRGLIEFNISGERVLIQLIEIITHTK